MLPRCRNGDSQIAQDSVSARCLPCSNAIELQRNCLAIQHRHQPAHRTHKTLARLAPVHVLRPVNGGDFFGQSLGQDLRRRCGPFLVTFAAMYSPLGVETSSSCATSTPAFLAKAWAAGVGWPSLYATLTEGPVICSTTSACDGSNSGAMTASRRGVSKRRDLASGQTLTAQQCAALVRAVRGTPHRSCAPEFLRNQSLGGNLACLQTIKYLKFDEARM